MRAEHYIPNPNNYPTVDHSDRCRTNNNISNLRWADMKTQCNNRKRPCMLSNNTSGYSNIYNDKNRNKWRWHYKGKSKRFNTLKDALCYKFIMILKYKLL